MTTRTVPEEITQPAAAAMREMARLIAEQATTTFNPVALHELALAFGVTDGPELRQRLAVKMRAFADVIEAGVL